MRVTVAAALAASISLAAAVAAQPSNQLSPAEQKAGWTLLFNGTSLDGWRAYKRPDASGTRWAVKDGLLCLDPGDKTDTRGARDIVFDKPYSQFELAWDWKVSPGGNSGLKYFVLEDRDAAIGHEYQLIDDAKHPDAKIGPHRQTAALYDVLAAANRPSKPAGEWNTSRVVVRGAEVEHWLNGSKVLSYTLDSPALREAIAKSKFKGIERFGKPQQGLFLLQDHGDAVCYRNVKVRALTGS
jgi:Domain of Unknown Function (DUF1080)